MEINKKERFENSSLISLFELKFKNNTQKQITLSDAIYYPNRIYGGRCLDTLKRKQLYEILESISFFIPAYILTEDQEKGIEDYLAKFYNKDEFFIYNYMGKVSGYKSFDSSTQYYSQKFNEKSEFYKISMNVQDYEEIIDKFDKDRILHQLPSRDWVLTLILMFKASYPIRMYGNVSYKNFEPLFDIMIQYFDFPEAISLASILLFSIDGNNLNANFAIPSCPSCGYFNNKQEMLVMAKYFYTTNMYAGSFRDFGIGDYEKNIEIQNLADRLYRMYHATDFIKFWKSCLDGTIKDLKKESPFIDFIKTYKGYIDTIKKQNAINYESLLKKQSIK